MKIKYKVFLNSLFIILFFLIFLGIFLNFNKIMIDFDDQERATEEILISIFDLKIILNDFQLYNLERAKIQWFEKHKRLITSVELDMNKYPDEDSRDFYKEIKTSLNSLSKDFIKLTETSTPPELREVIFGRLSIEFQQISMKTINFKNLLNHKVNETKHRTNITYFSLFFIFSLLLILGSYFITRSLTRPIKELVYLNKELERGNFKIKAGSYNTDEFKDLSEAFNKTSETLEKLNKGHKEIDAAKTNFLNITSHELRSPMTPIKAQLQMLDGNYFGKLNLKQKDSIELIIRNINRLDRIIVDFLDISRIEAARLKFIFKKVDLSNLLNFFMKGMNDFIPEKNINLKLNVKSRLPVIELDSDRLTQVLRNLVGNAFKFTPKNGTIIVSVIPKADHILFSVKDNGIGISQESQLHLFEPFYQADQTIYRKKGGTGLGLAISRGIILAQNGKIWFESKEGEGSTFYFTIPITPIKQTKPINILFSKSENIINNLNYFFVSNFGPMGAAEFNLLKKKGITFSRVVLLINYFKKRNIITSEQKKKELLYKLVNIFNSSNSSIISNGEEMSPKLNIVGVANDFNIKLNTKILIQKLITKVYNLYGVVAISKANKIKNLQVNNHGRIVKIGKNRNEILKELIFIYNDLIGNLERFITEKELRKILIKEKGLSLIKNKFKKEEIDGL